MNSLPVVENKTTWKSNKKKDRHDGNPNSVGPNFSNVLRTNFSYKCLFGSFSLVTCKNRSDWGRQIGAGKYAPFLSIFETVKKCTLYAQSITDEETRLRIFQVNVKKYYSGWEFTKLRRQICKIFCNFKVLLQSSYS